MIQLFHSWIYIWEKNKNTNSKRYMHPRFIAALFTIAMMRKKHKCPSTDK